MIVPRLVVLALSATLFSGVALHAAELPEGFRLEPVVEGLRDLLAGRLEQGALPAPHRRHGRQRRERPGDEREGWRIAP